MKGAILKLEITKAFVLTGCGPDYVSLTTTLPGVMWPAEEPLSLKFECAPKKGVEWVRENVGIEPEVVELGKASRAGTKEKD